MKHLMNEKVAKLTRRGMAFLLAAVLTTSAFVPGLTARATEDPTEVTVVTDPTGVPAVIQETEALLDNLNDGHQNGDGQTEVEGVDETEAPTQATTAPTEATTAPTEETTAPTEATTAPTEETTVPTEETTVPTEGEDDIIIEDANGIVEEIPLVAETFVQMTNSVPFLAATTEVKSPTLLKSATLNDKGNYDLKLTIAGAFAQETNPAKVDIVLIIDRSGSMIENNVTVNGTTMTRFANAISAAKSLVNAVSGNENINARYNILTFEGRIDVADGYQAKSPYVTASGWKTTKDDAITTINNIKTPEAGHATNYEAAFKKLASVNYRSGASKIVIFLTDGDPTIRVTSEDNTASKRNNKGYNYDVSKHYFGSGMTNSNNVSACLATAKTEIAKITMDRFYAIGTGSTTSSNLTQLGNAASKAAYVQVKTTADKNLSKIFNDIAKEITDFLCNQVTVTDTLAHNVDNKLLVDIVDPAAVKVTVYNSGTKIAGPAQSVTLNATTDNKQATISATYDETEHKLRLVFPADYNLEKTYTYELTAEIAPTEQAYVAYRSNDGYTQTGEAGTGTYAGEQGFRCNDGAVATYNFRGSAAKIDYAYPVIRLTPGTLVINKSFTGLNEEQISALKDTLTFKVNFTYPADTSNNLVSKTEEKTIKFSEMEDNQDGTFSYSFNGLSPDTKYSVTESDATVEYYEQSTTVTTTAGDVDGKTASGTVAKGATVNVGYTNSYTTFASVGKQVSGNLGDWYKDFRFTASIEGGSMDGIKYIKYDRNGKAGEEVTISGDTVSFTLKDDEMITFTNLVRDSKLVIKEEPENYELTEVTATNLPADKENENLTRNDNEVKLIVTGGNAVTFNNKLEATIDTGIALDSIPYIVILAGVAAAVAFLFLRKRRVED